jgi:hypothetical protein
LRAELTKRINAAIETDYPDDGSMKYPSIPIGSLEEKARRQRFLDVFDWMIGEIRSP